MYYYRVRGFINFAGCIADYWLSTQWIRYILSYLLEYSFTEEDLSDHVMGYPVSLEAAEPTYFLVYFDIVYSS